MDERFGRLRVSARAVAAREALAKLGVGDRLVGRVTGHAAGGTFVDLGFVGSFLPVAHDPDRLALERDVGSELEVFVLAVDPEVALVRLTRKDAHAIAQLLAGLAVGARVECTVTDIGDAGVFASVGPVEGLIPTSHLDRAPAADGYQVGDSVEAEIIEIHPERGQLTLSRRFVTHAAVDSVLVELSVGDIVDTRVTSIAPFGVFVELRGITGFVHRSELAWMHELGPEDFVVGSQYRAKIVEIDPDRRRVNLSFKQLTVDPAIGLLEGLEIGGAVHGEVTKVLKFGAFARLNSGLEGLIHYTELPDPVEPGSDEEGVRAQAAEGSAVVARVLAIDVGKRHVSLTLRRPHPWLDRELGGRRFVRLDPELRRPDALAHVRHVDRPSACRRASRVAADIHRAVRATMQGRRSAAAA
jgi:small subunit ribosomal protein S1